MNSAERLIEADQQPNRRAAPRQSLRPFGRRLGQKYPCPACEKRFVLEDHKHPASLTKTTNRMQ
jgi:hypothetical protein